MWEKYRRDLSYVVFGKGATATEWELEWKTGLLTQETFLVSCTYRLPTFLKYLKPIPSKVRNIVKVEQIGEVYNCVQFLIVLNLIVKFFSSCALLPTWQPLFPFLKLMIVPSCQLPTEKIMVEVVFRRWGKLLLSPWSSGPSLLMSPVWLSCGSSRAWKKKKPKL